MQWRQWQQQRHCDGGSCGNVGGGGTGSTTATVQEAATAAAEEADDGRDGRRLCSVFYFNLILICASASCIVPVTFAVYIAVAVSAAITVATADVISAGPLVDCCLCPPPSLLPLLSSLPPTVIALANYQGLQLNWNK
jgi:hypothetical protein